MPWSYDPYSLFRLPRERRSGVRYCTVHKQLHVTPTDCPNSPPRKERPTS